MLEWEVMNVDKKLDREIERTKKEFDKWFSGYWQHVVSREKMLSDSSPCLSVYYKMCKTKDEIKEKFPLEGTERCSSCDKDVEEWIETEFSFCDEYGCGMALCKDCAEKLKNEIEKLLK